MGGGAWSASTYRSSTTAKVKEHGDVFAYSKATASKPRGSWEVHENLDPKRTNKAGDHAGLITRESLDSDEHPESLPIAVIFDVTGSMGRLPRVLQAKLPQLHGLLMRKGYVDHPQILFGGVGDAFSDRVPLQIGQFESDNRMDECLENIFLEGGGGGGNHESYQLAAYFLARHTYLDSLEKRGKRGYCFLIGDERVYTDVRQDQVEELIGDSLQEDLRTEDVFEELQQSFHTFFLFAAEGSYRPDDVVTGGGRYAGTTALSWRDLLGQNALILDDAGAVCETIALTIGVLEGRVSLAEGLEDLGEVSGDMAAIEAASRAAGKALATVGAGGSGGAVVEAEGDLDVGSSAESGVEAV